MKINGFEVMSNGLTYDDYKHMSLKSLYSVPDDEYFITNKKLKLFIVISLD